MDNENAGGLPASTEKSAPGMNSNESMTVSEFAASLVKKSAPAKVVEPEVTEEVVEEPVPETVEGDKPEGVEQPEEKPETETEEVPSKLEPRTQEKIQKRIDEVIAQKKVAEGKAALLEARIKELEAKASEPKDPPPEPELIPVTSSDPSDLTNKAKTDADLDKLHTDAESVLRTYEANEDAITRAIARDEETVLIDGTEIKVAQLRTMKKLADKHIREHIPARRKFLKERGESVTLARKEFPALFDSRTQEYQELQWVTKNYPQLRAVPSLEYFLGFALEGMAARKARAESLANKPAVKVAAATPPKAAADTSETAAPSNARTQSGATKAKLNAELVKAEKEMDRSGSKEAYQNLLKIQSQLKNLN